MWEKLLTLVALEHICNILNFKFTYMLLTNMKIYKSSSSGSEYTLGIIFEDRMSRFYLTISNPLLIKKKFPL